MKKTKKKIGKCILCGIPVTKADMIIQKGEQKPKVVLILRRGKEMLACLAHLGVAEIFEMQKQMLLEDKRLKQRYGKLFSGPVGDPTPGSLKKR